MKTTLITLALLTQMAFAQASPPSAPSKKGQDSAATAGGAKSPAKGQNRKAR